MYRLALVLLVLISAMYTVQSQVPSYVPTNGLVGWWPFNGNANDESGFSQNGTVYGASLTLDRFGQTSKSYSFNGNNNYIEITSTPRLSITSSYSVSAWFNVNIWSFGNPDQHAVVSKIDNGDWYGGYEVRTTGGNFIMHSGNIGGANFDIGKGGLSSNTWYHVIVTFDGNKVRSYVNGVLSDSVSRTGTIGSSSNSLRFGRRGAAGSLNCWFSGSIDDIGIWNRALTQSEITALYQAAVPVTASASTVSNVSCFNGSNGSATVTPNGGTPPYSYSWNTNPVQTTQTATGLIAGVYTVTVTDSKGSLATANVTVTQPNAITNVIASTITNVGCFGGNNGSITVTNPTGGTPPYAYQWNTNPLQVTQTASNLVAGTYVVTVTDSKGCIATSTAIVTQPAQPLSNVIGQTVQHVKCNGTATGIVTVTNPVGGTPPYTYRWNTTPIQTSQVATNVPAGLYSITVTDLNGCTANSFATVTEPTKITNVQASVLKNVQCYGEKNGSASVSDPRGGTPPYTYQWNTTPLQNTQIASNLKAGEYIVTISDAMGCQAQSLITITQPNAPLSTVNAKVEKQISCFGENDGSVSIPTPTGGTPPYSVIWNGNSSLNTFVLTGLKSGTYTAIVKDANGCTVSSEASIVEPAQVIVTSPIDTTVVIQTKAEMVAATNQPASKYQWQSNTGTGYQNLENVFQYSGVKTPKLTIDNVTLANHNQPFRCIIETNGCYDTTAIAVLKVRTNVSVDEKDDFPLIVYPNPTSESDELLVQCRSDQSQVISIEMIDVMGISRTFSNIDIHGGIYPINISGFAKGMYILKVTTTSGIITEKVIIN
jgi:hypothetical protein